ncbi:sodium-coupled monocarboxylate transporter 1-like [Chrysoperla carnea]|uniref:sodium-coupled monocarboxylate transporter 1-like n=1 Tax=Chrysoperla carnea TaxID=189513 RepID=UPI001D08DC2B|nr:sodium-coupled monocarboxylate transporter 1-like [Chrysoperla carnea]
MLLICLVIGIYFGFIKVSKNVKDYLIGSKDMTVWPVTISLVVSMVSGISFLGLPAEVYVFGIQYFYVILNDVWLAIIGNYIYLPVFMDLRLTSSFEYLELRFDKCLRRLGSILYLICMLLWLACVIHVAALALNQVTGIKTHTITPIICAVCIFYTSMGGIRAIIWTDFLLAFLMVCSILLVLIKATWEVGGVGTVVERNMDSGRLEYPDMELSLTKRLTFPTILIGGAINILNEGMVTQVMMQRYMSLPTLKDGKKVTWLFFIIRTLLMGLCACTGLVIYATYFNCDPVSTNIVSAKDQLLPLIVVDTLKDFPGAAGLFLAGVFSASLSSLSGGLNSLATVILEDCVKPVFTQLTPKQEQIIVKSVVLVTGVFTVGLATIVGRLGQILQLSVTLESITYGPLFGMFTLGILFPCANAKGAFYAGLSGLFFMGWIGGQSMIASSNIHYPEKPVFTDGCTFNITEPLGPPPTLDDYDETNLFFMYRITFVLYTTMGTIFTIVIGLIISYFTGFNKIEDVNPLHLAPFLRPKIVDTKTFENKRQYVEKVDTNICLEEAVDLLNKTKSSSCTEK